MKGKNFEATTELQSLKAIGDSFSIVSDDAHHALMMPHISQSPHESAFRGKEHAAHVVMTKVDDADTLVAALEQELEAAVEDCPDVRDIALNRLKLNYHHCPSVQKTIDYRSTSEVNSGSGRMASGFLLGFWDEWLRSSLRV